MRRLAGLALALSLPSASCGGGSAGEKALEATEGKLDEIRSGRLSLRLLASAVDGPDGQGTGFQLEGRFAVGQAKGSLPVADLRYTRVTGSQRRTTRFLSTGSAAFVEVDGRTTRLSDQQVAGLRVDEEGFRRRSGGPVAGEVARRPGGGRGPPVDGSATERVTGAADPIAILNDLIALSVQFGGADDGPEPLEGDAAVRVRRAASVTTAEVVTGKEDRLLRRADVSVPLPSPTPGSGTPSATWPAPACAWPWT